MIRNKKAGRIIEDRGYNTVHGLWRYFTVSDGAFDGESDVFLIGTLDTFLSLKKYFKEKKEILFDSHVSVVMLQGTLSVPGCVRTRQMSRLYSLLWGIRIYKQH